MRHHRALIFEIITFILFLTCILCSCKKEHAPEEEKICIQDTVIVVDSSDVSGLIPHENPAVNQALHWFVQMQNDNGLLESAANSNFVSLYDNALAALVFIANEDYTHAESIFDFFAARMTSELQSGTGGFYQFRDALGTPNGNRWLGDNAWLLIALNNYHERTGSENYLALATALENWITALQDVDGGLWGGTTSDGDPIGKVTEGMIDAFNAVTGFNSFHINLLNYLENDRWNNDDDLLVSWPGNLHAYALDNFAWGYCVFEDFPISTLFQAKMFWCTQQATQSQLSVSGYCFDVDRDAVWLEGTGEMVVAFQKAGDISAANFYLKEMEKTLTGSPGIYSGLGLPYAANLGTGYGTGILWSGSDTVPCVSSTAWYVFGMLSFDPFAVGFEKNIPTADKFWL
jgi:cellulose synthase operon protein B